MNVNEIISYNVNGIRAAIKKGLLDWLKANPIDVLCIQETKAQPEQVPEELFSELGYQYNYWHSAVKKGYSGVAIFSKVEPNNITVGCGIDAYDAEGRVIQADFDNVSVINTYFPSGTSGDHRQGFKMQFLQRYQEYIDTVRKAHKNLVVCGDYNICHTAIDIHNPKSNVNTSGFLPEERAWMNRYFGSGMIDTFRHFNGDPHHYSWWSYRANARANNKGWRIDYIAASNEMEGVLADARIMTDAMHSDHCPIYLKLK